MGVAVAATLASAGAACSSPAAPEAVAAKSVQSSQTFRVPAEAGHVHGIAKDPASGRLLLAAHGGLFVQGAASFERVGPAIDLMGFTVAGASHFYASGHPPQGSDLPNPVGLIESVDGGRTWEIRSRGGDSDFHAMTAGGSGVVAFDGVLRRSDDGRVWDDVPSGFEPISLAGRIDDRRMVASTEESIVASNDAGRSWTPVAGSPAPALVSRADNAVIAVTADGRVHLAEASGRAWTQTDLSVPGPQALLASGPTARLEIVVLTDSGLLVSRSGRAFVPWTPA